ARSSEGIRSTGRSDRKERAGRPSPFPSVHSCPASAFEAEVSGARRLMMLVDGLGQLTDGWSLKASEFDDPEGKSFIDPPVVVFSVDARGRAQLVAPQPLRALQPDG